MEYDNLGRRKDMGGAVKNLALLGLLTCVLPLAAVMCLVEDFMTWRKRRSK